MGRIGGVLIALGLLMFGWGTVQAQSPNADLAFDIEDLDFILKQIEFAERHAAGEELLDILPNASIPWGLRTVDGSFNNLIPDQTTFGQADLEFPSGLERRYPGAQILTMPLAPGDVVGEPTSYTQGDGRTVQDSTPRLISHLTVNQSVANPAAVFAAAQNEDSSNVGPDIAGVDQLEIPNVAVDEGLSAPFNAFTTFFGQFFDHGLDLVNKGGNGVVFMPLQEDDPLYDAGPDGIPGNEDDGNTNFMLLTRATLDAGLDGIIGTADDVSDPINATTPHVDQQQTYASHASAQVLLRHYEVEVGSGRLQATGRLLNGFGDDQILDNADDGGMATWDTVQAQALEKLGIDLDDFDGVNMPMFAADPYGNFIPGPVNGLPQLVIAGTPNTLVEGNLTTPVDATQAIRINHSFFLDVAHTANPNGQAGPLDPDPDNALNALLDDLDGRPLRGIRAPGPAGTYDDELLGVHFTCGDGRCNENIALTTMHHIFHREHNRLTSVAKRVILDAGDLARLNEWLDTPLAALPAPLGLTFPVSDASLANQAATQAAVDALDLDWNGERIFQAARFGTEMQYNRIVFDEFAPTLAGLKDDFEGFHTDVDPTIVGEFAHTVYRFGHSMLTDTVDRFDTDFNTIVTDTVIGPDSSQLFLFEAFLNPLAFYNSDATGTSQLNPEVAAGAVVRGITRTRGNEIDEFVTGALQNNVYGLPLDLGAINIARGRDTGVPPLNAARRMFFEQTQDTRLKPYAHWVDYADNLRHEPSLVNFIAAYGTHPSVAGPDGIVGNADDPVSTYSGRRAAACAIVGALTSDPEAYCTGLGFPAVATAPITYTEDFEALAVGTDPVDWLDTGANNSLALDDLFAVADDGTDRYFSTDSTATNIHSHYLGAGADTWANYRYTGRMRITDPGGGIGVTALSDYPNTDSYYRLRRFGNQSFHLSPHPDGIVMGGVLDSGVVPQAGVWYNFLIEVEDTGLRTEVRAKVWADDGSPEPANFQIDAFDDSATRRTTGTVGVWSFRQGSKNWDDLQVEALGTAAGALGTPADALDFLYSLGDWDSGSDGLTTTGLDDVDFWNGGLAEERMPFGGFLGSTHNFVFETQIESLQNGDRFYYVGRTANIHLFSELESNSFTALAMRNTDLGEVGAGSLSLNIFSVPNHILEVDQSEQFDAAGDGTTADPEGDAELVALVIRDEAEVTTNIFIPDTTRVIQYTGGDHVTIGGTSGADTMIGGIGDDTISGGEGNDRIEGGDGADLIEGGAGDDIITDLSGPDVIEGGAGNDAISSGNEEDVIFGDAGNDFIVNSSEFGEIFAGLGDDYILDGVHNGHIRGGAGDDWMENLGGGEDLFQADNGAAAEAGEPPIKGNDVAIGHGGNNDFDMENGDDIIVDGPGIERAEGQLGFDWISFQNDRFGVNIDLDLTIFLRPQLPPSNDTVSNRYDRVEGISGSPLADILRGTPNPGGMDNGNELTNFALIEGLGDLVPVDQRRALQPDPVTGEAQFGWTGGELVLGGLGSDLMVGEGGTDIIDGDASLQVMIRTPDPAVRTGPLGQALRAAQAAATSTTSQSTADAAAAAAGAETLAAATAAREAADALVVATAAEAQAAADALADTISIRDAIGNLIAAALEPAAVVQAWQDFLASCSAFLVDLGLAVEVTTAETAAEALAAQAAAVATELASTQAALDATATASAAAAATAQAELTTTQAALDAADVFILVAGMQDVMDAVFGGFINPGELSISRVIGADDLADADTDIAVFSGNLADYTIVDRPDGFIEITDNRPLPGSDGRDLVRNVERLQFADQTVVRDIVAPINAVAVGQPTISGTPTVGMTLTASIAGVTDADNINPPSNPTGVVTSAVDWTWYSELEPGTNNFTPIERLLGGGDPFVVTGESLELTAAEAGLRVRVVGIFQDDDLVFETVTSAPVGPVTTP